MTKSPARLLIFGAACLAILIGFLYFGLWPFDFSPENRAVWRPDGKGLFLDGSRTSGKRSVGSIAFIGPLKGPARIPPEEACAFTLAIRLQPEFEAKKALDQILNIVDSSGKNVLSLRQWKKTLIIRWRNSDAKSGRKWTEFGVGQVLIKSRPRWLTIESGNSETVVSIDGTQAIRRAGPLPPAKAGGLRHSRIIFGNSPETGSPWTGTIFAFAIYEKSITAKDFLDKWDNAPDDRDGLLAAFNLEEKTGERGRDLSGNGNSLDVPLHIKAQPRILGWSDYSVRTSASIINDIAVNIIGFIPFGFFFAGMLAAGERRSAWVNGALTILTGISISLLIEIIQGFIPARDSDLADVLCNSAGSVVGTTGYYLFSIVEMKLRTKSQRS